VLILKQGLWAAKHGAQVSFLQNSHQCYKNNSPLRKAGRGRGGVPRTRKLALLEREIHHDEE